MKRKPAEVRQEDDSLERWQRNILGHELIIYRDRHVILQDHDLWVIRHFVLLEAKAAGFDDLIRFVEGWRRVGPGVWLGTEFDLFLGDNRERKQATVAVMSKTQSRLKEFGVYVPQSYLESQIDLVGFGFSAPQAVDCWVDKIAQLKSLIGIEEEAG